MSSQTDLGRIDRASAKYGRLAVVRLLLSAGWLLSTAGYFGPWISHITAGLSLSGVDMGEFVKFLPGVLDGTLVVSRQLFYLPPLAVVVSLALLISAPSLGYAWPFRALGLLFAVPVSLQLLPPAWSPASLMVGEFRLQTIAVGICWVLLAGCWLLGRLPPRLTGTLSAGLAVIAIVLPAWQFLAVKPAIDSVYRIPPAIGWGFFLCVGGLTILAAGSILFVVRAPTRSRAS